MSVCPINEDGYCPRHECVHKGNLLRYALQDDEEGESYRLLWDERLAKKKSGPGAITKAVNFGKALVRDALHGFKRLSDEAYAARLAICDPCPHCDKSEDHWRCKLCGCPLKEQPDWPGKARWASESCDDNRWPLPTVSGGGCDCGS